MVSTEARSTTQRPPSEPLGRGALAALHRPSVVQSKEVVTLRPSRRAQLLALVLVPIGGLLWWVLRSAALPAWIPAVAGLSAILLAALLFTGQLALERTARWTVFDLEAGEVRFERGGRTVERYALGEVLSLQLCPPSPRSDGRAYTELNLVVGTESGLTRINLARTLTHESARSLGLELSLALGLELGP